MAKKEFKIGLDNLLQSTIDKDESSIQNSAKTQPEKPVEVRATFILDKNQLDMLKAIAYWERQQIKQVLENAISQYIQAYSEEDIQTLLTAYKYAKS
jgi:hypothetical protein